LDATHNVAGFNHHPEGDLTWAFVTRSFNADATSADRTSL